MTAIGLVLLLLALANAANRSFPALFRYGMPLRDGMNINMTASPTVLKHSGDWVTVTIDGVSYGSKYDWVGVFAPSDFSPEGAILRYPMRWQYADNSCYPRPPDMVEAGDRRCAGEACCEPNEYHTTGSAVVSFRLINMRTDYVFALIQGNMQFPVVAAITETPVSFANPNQPMGVHLALTDVAGQMRVSWKGGGSTVHWGATSRTMSYSAKSTSSTYGASDMCANTIAATLGFRDPGTIHSAVMTGLKPGYKYYYAVDTEKEYVYDFVAPPATGLSRDMVQIVAFGDMGKAPSAWDGSLEHSWDNPPGYGEIGSWNTSQLLATEASLGTSLVVHIGDISYAVGYASQWDEFLAQIEPTASVLPWMTSPGNHEVNCHCQTNVPTELPWLGGTDSDGECGVPYYKLFPMPGHTAMTAHWQDVAPWYSFSHGPATLIMMSTEHDFTSGSQQLSDLSDMLQAVNRSHTPWVIFTGHRPMYVDSKYPEPSVAPLQKYVEPLLLAHKVDLALWGHHHSYHRSCRMAKGKCVADSAQGVTHAVIGAAGYDFSPLALSTDTPAWTRFATDEHYGYARLGLSSTELLFQFADAATGDILDQVTLSK